MIKKRPSKTTHSVPVPVYELSHVSKEVRDGDGPPRAILSDVTLTIERGELCCIRGQTGAGKSTLLNILGGLDTLSRGQMSFAGQPINLKGSRQMALFRRQIGFVFQNYQMLNHLSVYDNVAMPLIIAGESSDIIEDKVIHALLSANFLRTPARLHSSNIEALYERDHDIGSFIEEFISEDADHICTIDMEKLGQAKRGALKRLGHEIWAELCAAQSRDKKDLSKAMLGRLKQSPRTLSGGEKQRVALARALVHNPKVLLADEPTAALDALTAEEILLELESINRRNGLTIIIVSHNENVLHHVQRVITIDSGYIVDDQKRPPMPKQELVVAHETAPIHTAMASNDTIPFSEPQG